MKDVLITSAFRKPTFRYAVSPRYPYEEPWDSPIFLLAACVRNAGFSVDCLPFQNLFRGFNDATDQTALRCLIADHIARILIIASDHFVASRSTATIYGIRSISRCFKSLNCSGLVVLSGRLGTTVGRTLFRLAPEVDFIASGEADLCFPGVIQDLLKSGATDSQHVYARSIEDTTGKVYPAYITDLSQLPTPAFDLAADSFPLLERISSCYKFSVPFSIRTSYGCKFRCKFCAGVPNWQSYRLKSGNQIEREVSAISELGSVARLSFLEDELFSASIQHVECVSAVLRNADIMLDGVYTHAHFLTRQAARLLASMTQRVYLGMDSGDDCVLASMAKAQTIENVLQAMDNARMENLKVHLEWIIGSPDETIDSLIRSLSLIYTLLATHACDSINTYVYCPHPGTEYVKERYPQLFGEHPDLDFQESGGFPWISGPNLTSNQMFVAYLISQLIIREVSSERTMDGPLELSGPNKVILRELFNAIREAQ